MDSKKMIRTDNIWYKIKNFIKKIFNKKDSGISEERKTIITNKEDFFESISVKKELEEQKQKEKLAQKLMNSNIDVYDLTDEEVEEMTEWFKRDISAKNKELNRIKEHILQMKKELEEN